MSQRTNSPRPPTPNLPYSSNKQEFPTLSNSSLVANKKSPSPSQTPSPTKQNGVNSCKTSPSYEIPPRYKNFNYGGEKNRQQNEIPNSSSFKSCNGQARRLRTRTGSKSPPPLEPKLEEPIKETQLLKPKAEKGIQIKPKPEPVLSKEKLEDGRYTGILDNDPNGLTNVECGDKIIFKREEIEGMRIPPKVKT